MPTVWMGNATECGGLWLWCLLATELRFDLSGARALVAPAGSVCCWHSQGRLQSALVPHVKKKMRIAKLVGSGLATQ